MATVQYDAKTGKKLKKGESTTDALGNTFKQGTEYVAPKSSSSSSNKPATAPAYNAQTGATTGKPSEEYNTYLKSLNKKDSPNYVNPDSNIISTQTLGVNGELNKPFKFPQKDQTLIPAMIPPVQGTTEQQIADVQNEQKTSFEEYLSNLTAPPSSAESYKKAQKESGVLEQQRIVGDLTAQLNQITAQGQASQLQVVGQGRGIPEAIIGGQQAQIARETAIQALPVSAQLNAAQGNLAMAEQNLNTLFKIYLDDATNRYNYKTKINEAIYNFADKQAQAKLTTLQKKQDREYADEKDFLSMKENLSLAALKNGASQKTLKNILDSKDRAEAFFAAQGSLSAPSGGSSAPTVKTINGIDMQWNPRTGTWDAINPEGQAEANQKSLDQLTFLRNTAAEATKLVNAAGASWVKRTLGDIFTGDTKFRQLESQTNTLKTNVMSLMTDPTIKKFFGPQMSNADVMLMTSAGTTLNPQANTPTQMKNEIKRLDDLFNRMQTAVKLGEQRGPIITGRDGQLYEIIEEPED